MDASLSGPASARGGQPEPILDLIGHPLQLSKATYVIWSIRQSSRLSDPYEDKQRPLLEIEADLQASKREFACLLSDIVRG